jgi:ABC-type multidrug transport system ATPase subunit
VAIINKGSIVFSGSRNELREAIKGDKDQANPVSDIERAFTELIQSEKSDVSLSWLA